MDQMDKEFKEEQKEKIKEDVAPKAGVTKVEPANTSINTPVNPPKKKRNLLWLWILITAIVVGGGVSAFAYRGAIGDYFSGKKSKPAVISNSNVNDNTNSGNENTNKAASIKIVDEGITWISPCVKLSDLELFQANTSADANFPDAYKGTTYCKVATTSDGGEIVLAMVKMETMGNYYDFHHFIKKGSKYYWLSEHSDKVGGGDNIYFRTTSDNDATTIIKSLQLDKTITKGATNLTAEASASREASFAESTSSGVKVDETKWGDLLVLKGTDVDKSNGEVKVTQYYVLRNDGIKIIYWPSPTFRLDDGTIKATWTNSTEAAQKYSQVKTSGCGGGGGSFPQIIGTTSLTGKTQVGTSSDGTKIYTVSANSTLAEFIYQVYLMDGMEGKESKETFLTNLPVLIWQDSYSSWVIYMDDKYAPLAECGKPVIYLYPEKETVVKVMVGANITKSKPAYKNGWKVVAFPNGMLKVGNEVYDSLFWEGTGWGRYPNIDSGKIVESTKAASQIRADLAQIGLSDKEIADFSEFWLPKMPKADYTRLTWLLTPEMNTLAPLSVVPKPDTMIRIFLDFEGMNQKGNIAPQILPTTERTGFTLVEWGGLLRGKQ